MIDKRFVGKKKGETMLVGRVKEGISSRWPNKSEKEANNN